METVTLAIGCVIMEAEAGWGVKPDGYMIAVSEEVLDSRIKKLEEGNSPEYGFYEQRPTSRFKIALKSDKISELEEKQAIWVNNLENYGEQL